MVKHFFLLFFSFSAFSQSLSPEARVSLLTISPGAELYSTFGHSALRIVDPALGIDQNYNYGTFNFNAPGFYLKFLRGQLDYQIASYPFYLEMDYWNRSGRQVTEQVLRLSQEQKQKIFEYLNTNLLPENRDYRYLFLYDNCSTRLRDVLQIACGNSLVFDKNLNDGQTYRYWIDQYAQRNNQKWADFGMDLAIGLPSDQKAGWDGAMFIPDNLMFALDSATIKTDSSSTGIVLSKQYLNELGVQSTANPFTPFLVFLLLFVAVAVYTYYQYKSKSVSKLFDVVLFTVLGFAGWIILLLWFFTDHGVTESNLSILWASPLLLPAIYYYKSKAWARWMLRIFILVLVIGFPLVQFFTGPKFSTDVVFIVLIILIRFFYHSKEFILGFTRNKAGTR